MNTGPLKGKSEAHHHFDDKGNYERPKQLLPGFLIFKCKYIFSFIILLTLFFYEAGNIEINKGAEFAQKSSTSNYDYKSGFSNAKPEKVSKHVHCALKNVYQVFKTKYFSKVRIGDNLVPNGGIESGTEYKEKFDVVNINKSDLRSKPGNNRPYLPRVTTHHSCYI